MPYVSATIVFWIALAAVMIAGSWFKYRRWKETQETLRQAVASGQQLDSELLERLFGPKPVMCQMPEKKPAAPENFLGAGIIVSCLSVGIAILGYFVGLQKHEPYYPVYGMAAALGSVGVAFLIIWFLAWITERRKKSGDRNRTDKSF